MMILIIGFTCLPTSHFKFITKCDKCYYKLRQLILLQSVMVCYYSFFITKFDSYYKVRQNIHA